MRFGYGDDLRVSSALGPAGLEFHEEFHVALDVAGEAGFVEGDFVDDFGVEHVGVGVADGVFDLLDRVGEVLVGKNLTVGEDVLFHSFNAVDSPGVESNGAGEVQFGGASRVEIADEFADELSLGGTILFGHDVGQTGEGISEAVHGRFRGQRLVGCHGLPFYVWIEA